MRESVNAEADITPGNRSGDSLRIRSAKDRQAAPLKEPGKPGSEREDSFAGKRHRSRTPKRKSRRKAGVFNKVQRENDCRDQAAASGRVGEASKETFEGQEDTAGEPKPRRAGLETGGDATPAASRENSSEPDGSVGRAEGMEDKGGKRRKRSVVQLIGKRGTEKSASDRIRSLVAPGSMSQSPAAAIGESGADTATGGGEQAIESSTAGENVGDESKFEANENGSQQQLRSRDDHIEKSDTDTITSGGGDGATVMAALERTLSALSLSDGSMEALASMEDRAENNQAGNTPSQDEKDGEMVQALAQTLSALAMSGRAVELIQESLKGSGFEIVPTRDQAVACAAEDTDAPTNPQPIDAWSQLPVGDLGTNNEATAEACEALAGEHFMLPSYTVSL